MNAKEPLAQYLSKKEPFTYQDYLELPDDGNRYEVIEGELIMAPAPTTVHQDVSAKLFIMLYNHVNAMGLGKVYYAPVDIVLSDTNVVQPDLLYIAQERLHIITEKNVTAPPDLVVEIVSPGNEYHDVIRKKALYGKFGVREYLIVHPKKQNVERYRLAKSELVLEQKLSGKGNMQSEVLPGFEFDVAGIFE